MKTKNLFLHIGLHKTGTTSLQFFLKTNRDLLRRFGFLYPLSPIPENSSAHHLLSWNLAELRQTGHLSLEDILARLKDELRGHDGDLILSSEDFSRLGEAQIRTLKHYFNGYDIKVIIYLRRQDLRIESYYKQNVVAGFLAEPFESYVQRSLEQNDYFLLVKHWEAVFGKDRMVVRVNERSQIKDIREDFMSVLGIDDLGGFTCTEDKNVSPDQRVTELLRVLNVGYQDGKLACDEATFKEKYKKPLRDRLESLQEGNEYSYLDAGERIALMQKFHDSNHRLAQEFFERPRLFFEEPQQRSTFKFNASAVSLNDLLSMIDRMTG